VSYRSANLHEKSKLKNRNKSFLILKGYFKIFLSKEMKSCEGNIEETHPHDNSESSIAGTITE
jgi:hypothetical protein